MSARTPAAKRQKNAAQGRKPWVKWQNDFSREAAKE